MFGSKSKLIQRLYAEIARLRELLARTEGERDESRRAYDGMRDLAKRGVDLTQEQQQHVNRLQKFIDTKEFGDINTAIPPARYIPNYVAPEAKNCPECSVSVRPESWPAECPACHTVFGFPES